jgi:CheY-like chemotaxis protein
VSVPLIAVTGYGQETDRVRSQAAGFVAHFVKPVDLDVLKDSLERLLAGAGAQA